MTRRKYKISRILSNIIRSARWCKKEALSKKCDFRCAPYWSSKAISVSMYSVIRFYLSRKTNLRKTFLRKSSGFESHHGYISTTQKNLRRRILISNELYSVTGQPIFIEMIFSWILSVPEFVWMWGGGSSPRTIWDHWSVSLKTEIVRNSAIGRMKSICHF